MRKMLSVKTHLEVSLANVKKDFLGMEKYVLVSKNLCKFDQLKTFPVLTPGTKGLNFVLTSS